MLKTKNKISNAIQYIIVCMIMAGCTDNSISFDFNRNAVYTQEGNGIYNLFVEEEGLNLMAYMWNGEKVQKQLMYSISIDIIHLTKLLRGIPQKYQ